MSTPRKYRYIPSTTQTVTVRIACGTHRHKIVWTNGALSLPGHTPEELKTFAFSRDLGIPLPPCLQVYAYLKQRPWQDIPRPSCFPISVSSSIVVARYARRHDDAIIQDDATRVNIVSKYFKGAINQLPEFYRSTLIRELIPSLFHDPTSREHPLLIRTHHGWIVNKKHRFFQHHDLGLEHFLRLLQALQSTPYLQRPRSSKITHG